MSRDGQFVAYSTSSSVRVFKLNINGDEVRVEPLASLNIPNVQQLIFVSNIFLAAVSPRETLLVDIHTGDKHSLESSEEESDIISPISSIAVSRDEKWLAVGDMLNRIRVFDLVDKKYYCKLPALHSQHSAMSFFPSSSTLVVSAAEEIYFYDVEEQEFTPWSRDLAHSMPRNYTTCASKDTIVGIDFNEDTMLLWSAFFLCLVDLKEVSYVMSSY